MSRARGQRLRGKLAEALDLWRKVLQLLRYSSRRLSLAVGAATVAEVAFGVGLLYALKTLIDALSNPQGDGLADPDRVFLLLGVTGAVMVLALVSQSGAKLLRVRQGMVVSDYVDRAIHDRAIRVDLGFYESPRYFDSLQRARQAGTQRPAQVVGNVLTLATNAAFLLAVLVLMAGIDWRLLPVLLLAVVIALPVRLYFTRALFDWQRRRVQMERRAGYLDWLITSDLHAKELRLHGLGEWLREAYSDLRRRIRAEQLRIEERRALSELVVAVAGAAVFVGATAYLVTRVMAGAFSLGDLVLFLLLFRRAETNGRELVANLSRLYEDHLYLRQLFDFLEVEPEILAPAAPKPLPEPIREGLRLEGVDFRYPGNAEPTLEGIDLTLAPGRVVAMIGENGSGKTSLIKLICRLYDPDRGRITLDGDDIRDFDPEDYRRLFSVIFQDFARYAVPARDNIRFGDIALPDEAARVPAAARRAGADAFLETLPRGYDTPLSRIFDDGQEISIGQWQRVALARAFYPETRFLIMDEPTSAVDPRAEFALFDNFRERIAGRGALIISHRLSTVRMADEICVLDRGRIIEAGSHETLIARGGSYAALFEKQAGYFQ